MVDMQALVNLQGQMFLLMVTGYFFRKYLLGKEFQKGLTDFLIDLILPCNILMSFQTEFTDDTLRSVVDVIILSFCIQAIGAAVALLMFRKVDEKERPIFQYGTMVSNSGMLGVPVVESVFSGAGILLASIYMVPMRIFMWTLGVAFFANDHKKGAWKKVVTHPCVIAVVIGLVIMLGHIQLPSVLKNTISSLGSCNKGIAMFMVGMVMGEFRWKDFMNPKAWLVSAIRLLIMPGVVFLLGRLLGISDLAISVTVLMIAMPVGGLSPVLSSKYGQDVEFAVSCVTVSTICSLLTIPMWGLLMQ